MQKLTLEEFKQKLSQEHIMIAPNPETILDFCKTYLKPPAIHDNENNITAILQAVNPENGLLYYANVKQHTIYELNQNDLLELHTKQIIVADFREIYFTEEESKKVAAESDVPEKIYTGRFKQLKKHVERVDLPKDIRNKISIARLVAKGVANDYLYAIESHPNLVGGIMLLTKDQLQELLDKEELIDYKELTT